MPVAIRPASGRLSEKELAKFSVTSFDELLPKLQLAALYLADIPDTTQPVQIVQRIIESTVSLMEQESGLENAA